MKGYLLKEYGAWSVMLIAFLIGFLVSKRFDYEIVIVFCAISLLVNSKQAFTKWRSSLVNKPLMVFLAQVFTASLALIILFKDSPGIVILLPYIVIPVVYLLLEVFAGEHFIATELAGFAALSLSALVAKFGVTGMVDYRLYIGVAIFFMAGVFKIKAQRKKKSAGRILTALYVVFGMVVYYGIKIPIISLLPLVDNLVFAAAPYEVRLKVTGWIEVGKGILFLLLMTMYYQ